MSISIKESFAQWSGGNTPDCDTEIEEYIYEKYGEENPHVWQVLFDWMLGQDDGSDPPNMSD